MPSPLSRYLRPGCGVVVGQACSEPQTLMEMLVAERAAFSGAQVFLGANYSGIAKPAHADHLRFGAYCGAGHNRALADAGVLDIHPHPYSRLGPLFREGRIPCDVAMIQVSPPNARGEYSMGLGADYLVPALEKAGVILAEVNAQVPWTHSVKRFRREDFALLVESDRPPAQAPAGRSGPAEQAIARNAAQWIPEDATLEFGLGVLPDAVCGALLGRKNLAIHTGTMGDGIVELMKAGIVKRADCAMLIGSEKLFAFARENPGILLHSTDYTHDPRVLARIPRFVAINSAVEVDLTGQVNAEVAKGSYLGAVGGALDFMRAAAQSPDGVSLLLLPASRIVEKLSGPVSTPRSEAGVIVTERGSADLRGCSLDERIRRMRAISTLEAA